MLCDEYKKVAQLIEQYPEDINEILKQFTDYLNKEDFSIPFMYEPVP